MAVNPGLHYVIISVEQTTQNNVSKPLSKIFKGLLPTPSADTFTADTSPPGFRVQGLGFRVVLSALDYRV